MNSGMMYCSNPQCGKAIPSDSMFCPFCGNKQSMISHSDESIVIIYCEGDNCLLRGRNYESEQQETVRIRRGKNVISSRLYQWIEDGFWVGYEYAKEIKSFDLSNFDTSKVTDMVEMFYDCQSLETLELSGFDTSNVTYMASMFEGCSSLETLELSGFDTSNVTGMSWMFKGCSSLKTVVMKNCNDKTIQMIPQALADAGLSPNLITS